MIFSSRSFLLTLAAASVLAAEPVSQLPTVNVSATLSAADRSVLPQARGSVTALAIAETVNLVDTEDALKYLPSVFLRKRNNGDTQATLATRVWGVSSSARSLVYADGVLLSALIANNNSLGGPRWGLVAPAEIERIDIMYGPFAAAYAGNSMGAVVEIATRQPERFQASLEHTFSTQSFQLYGTHDAYRTQQSALTVGHRAGRFSFWLSANRQVGDSQPLNYVTSTTLPSGTTGAFAARNKFGQPAPIVGASGLLHSRMTNAKLKLACDLAPSLRAAYTFGLWHNDADARAETYLRDAAGAPTFAGLAGFATGTFAQLQEHFAHSFAVRSATHGPFDFEAVAALYRMSRDEQRSPTTASASGTAFGNAGRVALLAGTGWTTLDLKGTWRASRARGERRATHVVTFGLHDDRQRLDNPTRATADWRTGAATTVATEGDGRTRTHAVWAQDIWRLAPDATLTVGVRYERWRGYDGLNRNGATVVRQPEVRADGVSPKISAAWIASPRWTLTASVAQAYRFATAAELYQLVSTGTTFTSPNPELKPDDVLATELTLEHATAQSRARLSLFQDNIRDAIVTQFSPLVPGSPQLFSFASNVDRVRARGVELALGWQNAFVRGLGFDASATYLDARTLATRGQGQFGSALGKRLPNIPDWRATVVATWRPDSRWAFTLAGRYSGMLTTTLDAADTNPNTWQGFAAWFVADAHVNLRVDRHWSLSLGVDNFLNRKYFVFHPFPQRTVLAHATYAF